MRWIDIVVSGIDSHIWANKAIMTYPNFRIIQHCAMITCVEIISDMNMATKITMKAMGNRGVLTNRSK